MEAGVSFVHKPEQLASNTNKQQLWIVLFDQFDAFLNDVLFKEKALCKQELRGCGEWQFTWTTDPLAKTFPGIAMIAAVMARINLGFNSTSLKRK